MDVSAVSLQCRNEYAPLRSVLMCTPTYMQIEEVINEIQKHYVEVNIDIDRSVSQFNTVVEFLTQRGIRVELIPEDPLLPEQVFTRDIGVVIDNQLVRAALRCSIRQTEEQVFQDWLHRNRIQSVRTLNFFEGGDIVIDRNTIWVGVGNRTSLEVVEEFRKLFPHREVIALPFQEIYLHLDCVFNLLSPDEALIFKDAFDAESLRLLEKRYRLIEVPEEEQFTLATNVLSVGAGHVISLPHNRVTNQAMRQAGLIVHEIDLSEIIKSGGSFRCITLPLQRQDQN
ncbi:hypothetical protein EL26_09990 [Tumebacillus flagellatus]|uniref:Nitrate reductase n=2 Tax=Tumebacillus flagellatus TaxID=1157490 RepID=A0A074MCB1_9BACL|nr:hypothetical protein EL26_09990 [Tumebacillus flagellatus]